MFVASFVKISLLGTEVFLLGNKCFEQRVLLLKKKLCFWTNKTLNFENLPKTEEKLLYLKEKTLQKMQKNTCKEDFCT